MKKLLIAIFIILLVSISLTNASDDRPTMETYYSNREYSYKVNTFTDVVYIDVLSIGIHQIIPLYKADGSLMTGEELKEILNERGLRKNN